MRIHDTANPGGGEASEGHTLIDAKERELEPGSVFAYDDPATLAKAGRIIRAALARRRDRPHVQSSVDEEKNS